MIFHALGALALLILLAGAGSRIQFWSGGGGRAIAGSLAWLGQRRTSLPTFATALLLPRLWRESPLRWATHLAIAGSFVGLFLIGSLGDMVAALGVPLGKDDPWFAFTNDALGLTLLLGIALALAQRRSAPAVTRRTFEGVGLLALLALLGAGGFLVEAGRYLQEGAAGGDARYAFIGYAVARALGPLAWDWSLVHGLLWWSHGLLALSLVACLPASRLFHALASPVALVAATAGAVASNGKSARPLDAAAFFSPLNRLAFDACTRCRLCLDACESFQATGNEGAAPFGMIGRARALFPGASFSAARLLAGNGNRDQDWQAFQDGLFSCTLCGRCEEYCPVGIKTRDLALSLRQEMATARCMMPKNLHIARDAVLEEGNVFRFPNEDRALWAEFLDGLPEDLLTKERAKVLYFVGCVSSFSPAVQEIPQAFLQVLLKAGVDVALLAGKEVCCGFPLIMGGLATDANQFIDRNLAEVRRLGAETIVFNCPSCYYTWSRYYPLEGVRMVHSTQFIRDLVASGRLEFEPADVAVTYHDPCDLGRGMGEFEAPREVMRSFAGDDYVELAPSGRRGLCCGGGGDVEMWDPDLVAGVNSALVGAVQRTGAQLVVQACPQCKRITQRGLKKEGSSVRTMDITELALAHGRFVAPDPARPLAAVRE